MVNEIICYKNTGFDRNNRPSTPAVLATATATTFPSIWTYQNLDLLSVRIKAGYNDIADVDYVKIGTKYYVVTGLVMLTEQTAELSLSLDPIVSAGGIGVIKVVGGWDERAHVSNDNLFGNILSEPFSPSNRLERTTPIAVTTSDYGEGALQVVASTVDLTQVGDYADQYYDAASKEVSLVSVPRIPTVKVETKVEIRDVDGTSLGGYNVPLTSMYSLTNEKVKEGIVKARSLGIESAVTACYLIPNGTSYHGIADADTGVYTQIYNIRTPIQLPSTDGFPYKYGTYKPKNNKAYALFNSYLIFSVGSGDSREYDAHDIYNNDVSPQLVSLADLSPGGRPYIGPKYYLGHETRPFQDCISGCVWRNSPLAYTEASGSLLNKAQSRRQYYDSEYNDLVRQINTAPQAIASFGQQLLSGRFADALGTGVNALMTEEIAQHNKARQQSDLVLQFQTANNVVAPTVSFPVSENIQGFIGNVFYCCHTHLSEGDLERFDNFLTQFGYRVDKRFTASDLNSRKYFNYIKTTGAVVSVEGSPLRVEQLINDTLNGGVRLWHVLPNAAAMTNNPIA